jgi:transcriptional regulator with PAS, ATPase and Fis domain
MGDMDRIGCSAMLVEPGLTRREVAMFDFQKIANAEPGMLPGSPEYLMGLFNSIPLGIWTVDEALRITTVNEAALEALDIPRNRVIGKPCCDVFRGSACGEGCPLKKTMAAGAPIINLHTKIMDSLGRSLAVSLTTSVLRDESSRVVGGVATLLGLNREKMTEMERGRPRPFQNIVTGDPNMRQLFDVLPTISLSDSSVLVGGETGTGKNLLAKTIHELSSRASGPFVTVNCAALPESLLESELFGYKAGAFTGAVRDKPGRFAAAHGGTLFLDEIGDIPMDMQVKLLRVLQEKVYERLGDQRPIPCDIRIITATHRTLEEMLIQGTFRRDLYYRINVLNLEIPPLRNRKGDVPLLTQRFVEGFSRSGKKHVTGVTSAALEILMKHHYPGNVRELQNIIEHAWVMCKDHVIDVEHLPRNLRLMDGGVGLHQRIGLPQVEGAFILQVLERNEWHRSNAARELGIHRTTLQRKMNKLGLASSHIDGRFRH